MSISQNHDLQAQMIAIIGMEAHSNRFARLNGLLGYIYTGRTAAAPPAEPPPTPWPLVGELAAPDFKALDLPDQGLERLSPQETLLVQTIQAAVLDAGLSLHASPDTAVLVVYTPALARDAGVTLENLETYLQFSGPVIHHPVEDGFLSEAIDEADSILKNSQTETVILAAVDLRPTPGLLPGAAALVLTRPVAGQRAYARLIPTGCQYETQYAAGANGASASGHFEWLESRHLGSSPSPAFQEEKASLARTNLHPGVTFALGAADLSFGAPGPCRDLWTIAKAALCLYHRILPAFPGDLSQPPGLESLPVFTPPASVPWFNPPGAPPRQANLILGGEILHLEEDAHPTRQTHFSILGQETQFLAFSGDSLDELFASMDATQQQLEAGLSLSEIAYHGYQEHLSSRSGHRYHLGLLAAYPPEALRELAFARKGLPAAAEKGQDWQTPAGSYFTPQPVEGQIAFVYPGAFNSYPGLVQDLLFLFPDLYDHMQQLAPDLGFITAADKVYYRSGQTPEEFSEALHRDPVAMLRSGSSTAVLLTHVLEDEFDIHPQAAFGYSLGELSMLFACGVWTQGEEMGRRLAASPLFRDRLAGNQEAVRQAWGLPPVAQATGAPAIWGNYLLMAAAEDVQAAIAHAGLHHVYLTHVNTPRQVAVGGDPQEIQQLIVALGCVSLQAPFQEALHCSPIHSEYQAIAELHDLPVAASPRATLLTAASYGPMRIERGAIASQIAQMLTTPLYFPRLVQAAYQGGARLFIEVGAGSNCSKWIDDTLKGQPHLALSANRSGADDRANLLRLLVRLWCHRLPFNTLPLFDSYRFSHLPAVLHSQPWSSGRVRS
jgi:PfaB family protein